jgi:hypothetical protein
MKQQQQQQPNCVKDDKEDRTQIFFSGRTVEDAKDEA